MSSANESRLGYLLRTSVLSQLGGSIAWSVRWAKLDTRSTLSAWALGPSARPTSASDGGLFAGGSATSVWGTPIASDSTRVATTQKTNTVNPVVKQCNVAKVRASVVGSWQTTLTPKGGGKSRSGERSGEKLLPGQVVDASSGLWARPQARDWKDSGPTQGARKSPNLGTQAHTAGGAAMPVNWQTPTRVDCEQSGSSVRAPTLSCQAKETSNWSTPTVSNRQGNQYTRDKGKKGAERPTLVGEIQTAGPTRPLSMPPGESCPPPSTTGNPSGSINARWETALMGFPLGWLDISTSAASRLWATRKSPSA